jgi:acetyl-CoA carboxylase biotin carboxyl carrier protein
MDIKQIHELVKLINKSNIGELSIEENDFKITIKQKREPVQNLTQPQPVQTPLGPMPPVTKLELPKATETQITKEDSFETIKSPMIGTFYRQAGPGKPIFVNVGDDIVPGTVVCIIEAMKLFNEIESEITGKIVKVLVEDASPVEFDQPLFLVEPSA